MRPSPSRSALSALPRGWGEGPGDPDCHQVTNPCSTLASFSHPKPACLPFGVTLSWVSCLGLIRAEFQEGSQMGRVSRSVAFGCQWVSGAPWALCGCPMGPAR